MGEERRLSIGGNRRLPTDGEIPRDTDDELLCEGLYGPYTKPERATRRNQTLLLADVIHPALYEALRRMDEDESKKFARFVSMLSSLHMNEIERIYSVVKVFGFFRWLIGGIKWLVMFFIGGLAAVAAGGDQLTKIIGWGKGLLQWLGRLV